MTSPSASRQGFAHSRTIWAANSNRLSARSPAVFRRISARCATGVSLHLGARPWQVFALVTLPMIGQALVSAWLLTFTLSLDDVVLSAFLSGPGATTLPLVIFSRARLGLNPGVNAVATLIIAVVAIGVVLASFLIARNARVRAAEMAAAR